MKTDKNTTTDYRAVLADAEDFFLERGASLSPDYTMTSKGWRFHAKLSMPYKYAEYDMRYVMVRANFTSCAGNDETTARVRCYRIGYPAITYRLHLKNKGEKSDPASWRDAIGACAFDYVKTFSRKREKRA